jgi:oligosaccharide repeat unit polymerase
MNFNQTQRNYFFLAITFFFLALGIALGVFYQSGWQVNGDVISLTLLGLACAVPNAIAFLQQREDTFEPIFAFTLSTFVYFVFIPSVLLFQNSFKLFGIDYSAQLTPTTLLALLALLSFGLGYYWRSHLRISISQNQEIYLRQTTEIRKFLLRWSLIIFLGFSLLVVLWIVTAGMPIHTLWVIGEASYGDDWRYATGPQIGYLYAARESLTACVLMIIAFRSRKRWPFSGILLTIILLLFFAGAGARFRVLLLVLGVILFYYIEKGTRPKVWQSTIVAFVIFYFIIGAIGFYRGQKVVNGELRGVVLGEDTFTINDAWDTFVSNSEIAVSSALLVRVVPAYQPYFMGSSFLNTFTQPIPRFLWPDKPKLIGQEFFDNLWPPGTTLPFWALFYLNFGPAGIVPGMILWGWISRTIYDAYSKQPTDKLAQVQLAVYWPFIIHMYGRGGDSFAFNFYGLIYVLAPVWIMLFIRRWKISSLSKAHSAKCLHPRKDLLV